MSGKMNGIKMNGIPSSPKKRKRDDVPPQKSKKQRAKSPKELKIETFESERLTKEKSGFQIEAYTETNRIPLKKLENDKTIFHDQHLLHLDVREKPEKPNQKIRSYDQTFPPLWDHKEVMEQIKKNNFNVNKKNIQVGLLNFPLTEKKEKWDSDSDSDLDDEEKKELTSEDFPMAVAVGSPIKNKTPNYFYIVFILIFIIPFYHSFSFSIQAPNIPAIILRFVIVSFSVALALALIQFVKWTNEDSISGMVAQRHYCTSYVVILLMIQLTSFVSGLFIVYAVRSWVKEQGPCETFKYLLGFLSPLLSSGILLVPLLVYKTKEELGFQPMKRVRSREYRLRLCKCIKSDFWHFFFVGTGVVSGYITVVLNLYNNAEHKNSHHYMFSLFYLIISIIFCVMFLCWPSQDRQSKGEDDQKANIFSVASKKAQLIVKWVVSQTNTQQIVDIVRERTPQQARLIIEFIGLYYYLAGLTTVLVMNKDLIEDL